MNYHHITLDNGLRIVHVPSTSQVVYCGFAVDAGTRDELEAESGMAHFCEHMTFKGTTRRRSIQILNALESVGGELNAYTSKEETIFYAAVLCPHFHRAVDLLTDIVLASTYPQAEINKEVEVIVDEIQSYEDNPSELIFDEFDSMLFPHHALGRSILGHPDRLRTYQSADASRFTARSYAPDNLVFFVYGNLEWKHIVRLVDRATNQALATRLLPFADTATRRQRETPPPTTPSQKTVHKDTHQAHILLGGRSYSATDPRRMGLYLLNNLLGGPGMNSRLNVSLREKRGLVYTVESNVMSHTDAGYFCIYIGCDKQDINRCLRLTHKELQRLVQAPLSPTALAAAKRQLIGQMGIASDHFESYALAMGKQYLHYHTPRDPQQMMDQIAALQAADLQQIAAEVYRPETLSTLIYS